jgi:hypothetical protein
VGRQREVDFLEHGVGQAIVADQDDGAQRVSGGPKVAALTRGKF